MIKLLHRLGSPTESLADLIAGLALLLLGCGLFAGYCLTEWRSVSDFVMRIDGCEHLFGDFVLHYYPMGQVVFDGSGPVQGFFYSPACAIMFGVFQGMDLPRAVLIWGAVQLAAIALFSIYPCFLLARRPTWQWAVCPLITATSFPILHNFKWGQVSVLVTGIAIAFAWLSMRRTRASATSTSLLAFATTIKYYPAVLAGVLLLKRDWQGLAWFAGAVTIGLYLFPAIILGPVDTWEFYQQSAAALGAARQSIEQNPNSLYLAHVAARMLDQDPDSAAIQVIAALGIAIALLHAWLAHRLVQLDRLDAYTLITLAFTTIPLLVRTSWPHYLVYLPACQTAVLFGLAGGVDRWGRWFGIGSVLLSNVLMFDISDSWQTYNRHGCLLYASLLLQAEVIWRSYRLIRRSSNEAREPRRQRG